MAVERLERLLGHESEKTSFDYKSMLMIEKELVIRFKDQFRFRMRKVKMIERTR